MRPDRRGALLGLVLALALLAVIGCGGEEETHEVEEGVPLELGDLEVNVQLTRFLNPSDPQDSEYVAGQEVPPPPTESYLAVFMTIENTSDDEVTLPGREAIHVADTTGATYEPLPSATDYAVPLGSALPEDGEIPVTGGAAQSGPIEGSLVLFLVEEGAAENRPLELEIEHEGETGIVTLDI